MMTFFSLALRAFYPIEGSKVIGVGMQYVIVVASLFEVFYALQVERLLLMSDCHAYAGFCNHLGIQCRNIHSKLWSV